MWLIVGLGNPGRKYTNTRHNVGFQALSYFAYRNHIHLSRSLRYKSIIGKGKVGKEEVVLLQPLTYINNSGVVLKPFLKRYRIKKDKLLILCDDLNLPIGKVRLRPKGSDGGHKGLKSIISCLGLKDFPRLRIGIGSHTVISAEEDWSNFVLSPFNKEEKVQLKEILKKVAAVVEFLLEAGMEETMSRLGTIS